MNEREFLKLFRKHLKQHIKMGCTTKKSAIEGIKNGTCPFLRCKDNCPPGPPGYCPSDSRSFSNASTYYLDLFTSLDIDSVTKEETLAKMERIVREFKVRGVKRRTK